MKKTRLYDKHVALGARIVDFAGWQMPVQYPSAPLVEHRAVRSQVGLFDIDHMGQIWVKGPDALSFLQSLLTADISKIPQEQANYSLLCYQDGGAVDDLFVYALPEGYFIAANASNIVKDVRWLKAHQGRFNVAVADVSEETYMLALQGPQAAAVLQQLTDYPLHSIKYHGAAYTPISGVRCLLGRTGYTGEDGFELFFPADEAPHLWDALLAAGKDAGICPIGLAARDSLRFEACMPLYGQELGSNFTPLESGFSWAVSFDKGEFIGRDALLKQYLEGVPRKLVGLEMVDRAVPRHGYPVLLDGKPVGEVTSGMYAPTLDKYLAMALVKREFAAIGTRLQIEVRGRSYTAQVVKKPFYTPAYRRNK